MGGLVFAGAFNPPTVAHTRLAQIALEQTGSEYVTFVPSKQIYIRDKQKKSYAISDGDRLSFLYRLAENRPWMRVTDYEIRQTEQPRTYLTMKALQKMGLGGSLLIGTDKLSELDYAWRYVTEIAKEFGIVCMEREQDDAATIIKSSQLLSSLSSHIRIIKTPTTYRFASSTKVRTCFMEIEERLHLLQEFLEPEVYDEYIVGLLRSQGRKNPDSEEKGIFS